MPFIGLSALIQLACIIHVLRTGRQTYWIMVILFLPFLGALAYAMMEILPEYQGNRHVRGVRKSVANALDPERELRAARDGLDLADTVANRIRLADALAALKRHAEAVPAYREAIAKVPEPDPGTEVKLAAALFESGDVAQALTLIDGIAPLSTQSERDRLALLRARVLAELGRKDEARALFADIVTRMPGEEARCRYAALLLDQGYDRKALVVLEEVEARMKRLDRAQRAADADMYKWAMERLQALRATG